MEYHESFNQTLPRTVRGPERTRRDQREVRGRMRPYEVMVILDAGLDEDVIRATVDQATELITSKGGTPPKVERWGKRRFAYELKHKLEGYYVLIETTAEPATMADLDRMLHLADEVVRHKIIRLPDKRPGRGSRPVPVESGAVTQTQANGA
ncbi:MAG TPA: 30S ribosomal protein S6 [Acidimicrobiales bacterium]|nr:30S ribosomal protein S6 [Acidimicrobiales bacterium]